jgi:hypothetical protein
MKQLSVTLVGMALLALAATAQAGKPIVLNDQQLDVVSAGSATAATAVQSSARGRNATLSTFVGNVAADLGSAAIAQSRGSVFARGASVSADVYSVANAHPFAALSGANGAASGQSATLHSLAMTSAVSAGPFGASQSLTSTTFFSRSR